MINRRELIQASAFGAAALGMTDSFLRPAAAQAGRPFSYAGYGGSTMELERKFLLDPAAARLNLKMVFDSSASTVKLQTMVQSNNVGWDIVSCGPRFLLQGAELDVIEKLDPAVVDQTGLPEPWRFERGIVYLTSTYVVAYNSETYKGDNIPETWADFWDVKRFPGPRTMYKELNQCYEVALRAAGVPRNEIYPATDEKMKIAFAKFNEIKPHVKVWWVNAGQPGQLLATGEVTLAMAMTGRLNALLTESVPVKWGYKDGIITNVALCIPKGTPYKDQAMQVLGYILSDEAQTALLNAGLYGPSVESVIKKATPEQLKNLSLSPENLKTSMYLDTHEVHRYVTKYGREWLQFIAG